MTKQIIPNSTNKVSGVYKITCTANGKVYVGSAIDVKSRIRNHKSSLNCDRHHNSHLANAWRKYGAETFLFEIIEEIDDTARLIEREQWWIDRLDTVKSGFNIRPRAESCRGIKHSEQSKQNMSKAQKGLKKKPLNEEQRRHISEIHRGKTLTEEHRQKISKAMSGRKCKPMTEEHLANLSKARKGKRFTEEHKRKLSEARKGIVFSEEHRRNLSEARMRYLEKTRADKE